MRNGLLIAAVIAVVGRVLADEVKAWIIWIRSRLLRNAVMLLPVPCRERYQEEWEGDLEAVPGEFARLFYALGLIWAALGIRRSSRSAQSGPRKFLAVLIRLLDITISSLLLLAVCPVMAAIAIAIKLDSPGPVLIGFRRGPQNRSVFLTSFRTLVAEKIDSVDTNLPLSLSSWESASRYKFRVTPLGLFLRKYDLDSLPNFFDVLRGNARLIQMPSPGRGPDEGWFAQVFRWLQEIDVMHLLRGIFSIWWDLGLLICGRFGASDSQKLD
jgi:hypothetical protein